MLFSFVHHAKPRLPREKSTEWVTLGGNAVHTGRAKHVAVLDVFFIAAGFVLRVYLGCFLVEATPSDWLVLCSSALALLLGFAKRRSDLNGETGTDHRRSLEGYTQAFLDQAMALSAAVALVSYALYTVNSEVLREGRQLASLPFVAYGILSYLRRVGVDGAGESPVDIAFRSRPLQICAIGWVLSVLWSLKSRLGRRARQGVTASSDPSPDCRQPPYGFEPQ